MKYLSSIHTHTEFCDAHNTMEEMAEEAAKRGLTVLGFSPHSPLPYENNWAMREESYPLYFSKVEELKERYKGKLQIYKGIELDSETKTFPENLDYVIGSVHSFSKNGVHFSVDYKKELLDPIIEKEYHGNFLLLAEQYFQEVVSSATREKVDVVGHFDLITKYNKDGRYVDELHDPDYIALGKSCIDEILKRKPSVLFEINTGVMARAGKAFPYPSPVFLRYLMEKNARLVLTSDCHRAFQIDFGFSEVLRSLENYEKEGLTPNLFVWKDGIFQRWRHENSESEIFL